MYKSKIFAALCLFPFQLSYKKIERSYIKHNQLDRMHEILHFIFHFWIAQLPFTGM